MDFVLESSQSKSSLSNFIWRKNKMWNNIKKQIAPQVTGDFQMLDNNIMSLLENTN
jgi:hypothetical protein